MPLHPRYTKNPFMVNKNMSLAHENKILNLWNNYKNTNPQNDYLALNFYHWLEKEHRELLSFRCTFAEPKRVILALCYKNK